MRFLFVLLLIFSSVAHADNVKEIFGNGIFETSWGASLDEVRASHPDGEFKQTSGMNIYNVINDREVLSVERKKNAISFLFTPDMKLYSIITEFKDSAYGSLLIKLSSLLGDINKNNDLEMAAKTGGMTTGYTSWASDDGSVKVSVYMAQAGLFSRAKTFLRVENTVKTSATKESLGL